MVRRTSTEYGRTRENTLPRKSFYCCFHFSTLIGSNGCNNAICVNENQFYITLWDLIYRILSRNSIMNKKMACMKLPALRGAPEGPQVDRGLYEFQCDTLQSHIMTREASQIPKNAVTTESDRWSSMRLDHHVGTVMRKDENRSALPLETTRCFRRQLCN